MNTHIQVFVYTLFAVILVIYQGVELLRHVIILFDFRGTTKLFHNGCTVLHFIQQYTRISISPHSWPTFAVSLFLLLYFLNICFIHVFLSYYSGCEVLSRCGFDLHFTNDQWCLVICLSSSLAKCLFNLSFCCWVTKVLNFGDVLVVYFFFCCLRFWYHN